MKLIYNTVTGGESVAWRLGGIDDKSGANLPVCCCAAFIIRVMKKRELINKNIR